MEALSTAAKGLASFQGKTASEFLRWLRSLTRFAAAAHRRHEAPAFRYLDAPDPPFEIPDPAPAVVDRMVQVERRVAIAHRVRQALESLRPLAREIVQERYFEDKPISEIARAHGFSSGRVRVILHRARKSLRTFMDSTSEPEKD